MSWIRRIEFEDSQELYTPYVSLGASFTYFSNRKRAISYVNNMDALKRNAIGNLKRKLSINNSNLYQTCGVQNIKTQIQNLSPQVLLSWKYILKQNINISIKILIQIVFTYLITSGPWFLDPNVYCANVCY